MGHKTSLDFTNKFNSNITLLYVSLFFIKTISILLLEAILLEFRDGNRLGGLSGACALAYVKPALACIKIRPGLGLYKSLFILTGQAHAVYKSLKSLSGQPIIHIYCVGSGLLCIYYVNC